MGTSPGMREEESSSHGAAVIDCQAANSRKTTLFWLLITQVEYYLPCILAKVMKEEIQSKYAGKDEILLGFNLIIRD